MKSRLHKIEIQNFKAFRQFSLNLEGRHLLLYGANGAGKSSLYWSLYTFLQSAEKRTDKVSKYFDPTENQNLLNIHEDASANPGRIALTIRDSSTQVETTYPISKEEHGTDQQPLILKGNLASDFITYRFFFGFSNFKNSEPFNLWPLFESEILPFCKARAGRATPQQQWNRIKSEDPNPNRSSGSGGTDAYTNFTDATARFAETLKSITAEISIEAQKFYEKHFSENDPTPIKFGFGLTRSPSFTGTNLRTKQFRKPILELHIRIEGKTIKHPQSFLNEAKLTQLALSVRFAASNLNLHESDFKLLILDDLLVSLDMDNRMKVVEILLSEEFSNSQKIILTHDRGFFEEFKRVIGPSHSEWAFCSLQGNPKDGIRDQLEKSPIQKAEDYIRCHDLEGAAVQLRKAAEETAKRYRRVAMGEVSATGEFHSLSEDLKAAKNHLLQQHPLTLYNQALAGIPKDHRDKLISSSDEDIDNNPDLDPATKGKIKTQRQRLKQFVSQEAWKNLEAIEAVDSILKMKDRVLNPAAHWNETPLYDAELKKAQRLIQRLETVLLK